MMIHKYLKLCCLIAFLGVTIESFTQPFTLAVTSVQGEKWWGGYTALGSQMPFSVKINEFDMEQNNLNNQTAPLLLSSKGRYIWCEKPFRFHISGDTLIVVCDYIQPKLYNGGNTLREAYIVASQNHFPPTGKIPADLFFSLPQYNTWIELMYNQNQSDILNYAKKIKENNFPVGVFMIDDNWQKYYGNFDFKPERFPDPKAMIESLHADGFKVMLWVCPYVSSDSPEFRYLREKGYLVKAKGSQNPAIINWWNGYSTFYDLTNPEAMQYLCNQLKTNQNKYGVDGFKFDGADVGYMCKNNYDFFDTTATNADYTQKWADLGLRFPFNEYRATWKMGGTELVQRLGDKAYSWDAVAALIPEMTAAGLLGHLYTCPDMIGGGAYTYFLNIKPEEFDQELIVRSAQIHAMMPMMQFSVAPWRILDEQHLDACRKAALLHQKMSDYILQCAHTASITGEPIVRNMEYAFPNKGYEMIKDQFMLGEKYMVAPMVTSGNTRIVVLPKGIWKDDLEKIFKGPNRIEVHVSLERVPYYELIKN